MGSITDAPGMKAPDMVLRRADFSLSQEQEALRDAFRTALERTCPIERVEAADTAEPPGYDEKVWRQLLDMRAVAMGVPADAGGDGAGLCELVLVAEQQGLVLAPAPLIEAVVATRLLARCGGAADWLAGAMEGNRLVTVALHAWQDGEPQLVPAGAIADGVIGLVGDDLVVLSRDDPPPAASNHGSAPLALWDPGGNATGRRALASGAGARRLFEQAVREWKLLTAAAMVGLAGAALRRGVEFATNRVAFGVPIATFQAVSHPLVDVAMAVTGVRRLVWKAAWYADNEPDQGRELIPMAYLTAVEAGMKAPTVGVHVQGGLGFTVESDMHLFFRRAKGWTLVTGDPARELGAIAGIRYGEVVVPAGRSRTQRLWLEGDAP
jgi:alkylation response protein AidB-like acyl-CoA dehydrogenase